MKSKKLYLGCSGWYYDHWIKRFYPEDLKKTDWLEYYSHHFNTVEINNTFYRFPSEKTLKSWYKKTPGDFLFTLKVNQSITHRKKFNETEELLKRFYDLSEILEDKLGCLLFQIPPYLHKNMVFLKRAVEQLDTNKKNVLEFRDSSWFDNEVYEFLSDNNVAFCTVSESELPDDLIDISSRVYVRFHGTGEDERYQHLYSAEELENWARKIKNSHAEEVFCYFNNDYEGKAVRNCEQLREMLE